MHEIYSAKHYQQLLLILILVLGIFLIFELTELLNSILGAIVLYTLFKPFYLSLRQNYKINSGISSLIIMLISFLIIVIPFTAVSWMMINKINEFRTQGIMNNGLIQKINDFAGKKFDDPLFFQHKLQDLQTWAFGLFSEAVNSVIRTIFQIVMMYFILYFMFVNHETFEGTVSKYIPIKQRSTTILGNELRNITHSNILGQAIIAIAQSICVITGFAVFKLDDPIFWGVIAGFLSFIPILGVPAIFIGAATYSFITGNNFAGIGMIIWGIIVIAVIENYLRIYLGRRIADAHPLITVIGVIIGLPTFGIVGIVFGPLLLSYFVMLVKIYEEKYILLNRSS
jgi:predicted PurR-regulated permease PerM